MGLNLAGQRCPHLGIPKGVEVSPVEGKGAIIRPGTTAVSEVEDGLLSRIGPGLSLLQSWTIDGRGGSDHHVAMKGQESDGDVPTPGSGLGGHGIEGSTSLLVGNTHHAALMSLGVGEQLGLVRQRIQLASEQLIEGHFFHQECPNVSTQTLGSPVSLNIGNECTVEVVHRNENDSQMGFVEADSVFEEPLDHSCGVAGLTRIHDFYGVHALRPQGGFSDGSNTVLVTDAPAENGRVTHHCHSKNSVRHIETVGGSQSIGVGGDAEIMGLSRALHPMVREVGSDLPTSCGIGSIGGSNAGQSASDFRQTQQCDGHDQAQAGFDVWSVFSHLGHFSRTVFLVWLCFGFGAARADVEITLQVSVVEGALKSEAPGAITAKLRWLGEDRVVPLNLSEPGLWTGSARGPQARTVGVEIWLAERQPQLRVSQGLEVMPKGDVELSWSLSVREADAAWRLSEPVQLEDMRAHQERLSMVWGAWSFISVLVVLVLGRRALGRSDLEMVLPRLNGVGALVLWLAMGVAWTWPSVLAGPDIVGRHFDALGTVWVIDSVGRLGFDLHDPFSAWPKGATYSAIDSWLLMPISLLGSALDPARVHGWITVLGLATSGYAASIFARCIGATSPFHHVGGLIFAGSGLAAAAILEGHVYQIVNPWMPLMAIQLWKAGQEGGRFSNGVWAGVFFGLALFSSGYLGVSAGLVGLGLGLAALKSGEKRFPALVAAGVAAVFGVAYLVLFSGAGQPGATHATTETLRMGSLSLNSMGPATAEIDRTGHSWSLAVSAMIFSLALIALAVRQQGLKVLAGISLVSIVIAMGPDWTLGVAPDEASMASPLQFLWDIPSVRFLRFPGRVLWAAMLCLSALSAVGVTVLARRLGARWGYALCAVLVVEALVCVRLPWRQQVKVADTPLAYASAQGPVFDLTGEGISVSREVDSWMNAILCQYQTHHKQPIAEDCVAVGPSVNPRVGLARWVAQRLYEGDRESVINRLKRLGFAALAVHYDWIDPGDRLRLQTALKGLSVKTETDVAEAVAVYRFGDRTRGQHEASGSPARLVGPPSGSVDWKLRIDLMIPKDKDIGRFFAIVEPDGSVELKDKAGLPGDQYNDGIYSATLRTTVAGEARFRLVEVKDGETTTLWGGAVVPLNIEEDRVTFRMEDSGRTVPHLRALEIFSPEVRNRGGKIGGLTWLASFVLMGLWWLRFKVRRRDQFPSS